MWDVWFVCRYVFVKQNCNLITAFLHQRLFKSAVKTRCRSKTGSWTESFKTYKKGETDRKWCNWHSSVFPVPLEDSELLFYSRKNAKSQGSDIPLSHQLSDFTGTQTFYLQNEANMLKPKPDCCKNSFDSQCQTGFASQPNFTFSSCVAFTTHF